MFCVIFGFLSGSYSLMMVIPARLLGEEKFSLAYGFMLAGEGIGVYLGPPLVGKSKGSRLRQLAVTSERWRLGKRNEKAIA